MGALGKFSRVEEPLIFVTELVAFFEVVGKTSVECHKLDKEGVAIIKDGLAVKSQRIRNFSLLSNAQTSASSRSELTGRDCWFARTN